MNTYHHLKTTLTHTTCIQLWYMNNCNLITSWWDFSVQQLKLTGLGLGQCCAPSTGIDGTPGAIAGLTAGGGMLAAGWNIVGWAGAIPGRGLIKKVDDTMNEMSKDICGTLQSSPFLQMLQVWDFAVHNTIIVMSNAAINCLIWDFTIQLTLNNYYEHMVYLKSITTITKQ